MDIVYVEIFGFVMLLFEFEMDDEVVVLVNDSDFFLCGSVFLKDIMRVLDIFKWFRLGVCYINGLSLYVEFMLL